MVYVDETRCTGCGTCLDTCPLEAISLVGSVAKVNQRTCSQCEACVQACPNGAILVVAETLSEKAPSFSLEASKAERLPSFAPLQARVLPFMGAALAFLGQEVTPRVANYLLDRRLSQRPAGRLRNNPLAPVGERQVRGGFHFRQRRRGLRSRGGRS